jgi:mRNA interferase YafQ
LTAKPGRRAAHPRACDYAKAFSKDWARLARAGRNDLGALKEAILLLIANDAPLSPEWKDHPLKGEWANCRECHVGGDFLLIYRLDERAGKAGAIVFIRAGTHSDLFSE